MNAQPQKAALISVFNKEGIDQIARKLHELGIKIFSTGGTEAYIRGLGYPVTAVEEITGYPSILGGRVKTLHPKIFGGILSRRKNEDDIQDVEKHDIPPMDFVIVDLYPFENTVAAGAKEAEVIEKIDIGGISLIRAAAKNYKDVLCVSSQNDYAEFLELLEKGKGKFDLKTKKRFAARAFAISSHYDTAIFNYFNDGEVDDVFKLSLTHGQALRYGENPHQRGLFFGNFEDLFDKLHGKELSYNNLLDVDAAVQLMAEFKDEEPTFAILKHNNACGLAQRPTLVQAYKDALAGDPLSAFGGILIANQEIDEDTAAEIHKLFCEVVIAPSFSKKALEILKGKKNRILLLQKGSIFTTQSVRTCLNGLLVQDKDSETDTKADLKTVTDTKPTPKEVDDMLFASKIGKHTKSNTIVLAKDKQLCASGAGQTSRVDALEHAIEKAQRFNFDLKGAVMASDAFFPFPDCVEIADRAGIKAVLQPGGSRNDKLSIEYCNDHQMSMVLTGTRHFKH